MSTKLLIFDSHPVQYKAPVYQALQEKIPDAFKVVYATDSSANGGYLDRGFGRSIRWNQPLLEGYPFEVLSNQRGSDFSSRRSLSGKGVWCILKKVNPKAVLLTQNRYEFDYAALIFSLLQKKEIWIRQETQDEMFSSRGGRLKNLMRSCYYRTIYLPVEKAFCFGKLNRDHLIRFAVAEAKIREAKFSVPNPFSLQSKDEVMDLRTSFRHSIGIRSDDRIIAFFGKLIPKKNPDLLFDACSHLSPVELKRTHLIFVGSGELESDLRERAQRLLDDKGVPTTFLGFVNQAELPSHYAGCDVVVLPSRRQGEAWGLVINEALQAGCAAVASDAVGCWPEFASLERFRVFKEGDPRALADALSDLMHYSYQPHWAAHHMSGYSSEAAADAIAREIELL